ncbi:MAG: CRISPR-associated endonuclease Cas3'', partial [Enterococcus thailandicus]|nr:CRISPR-associated endonuclease Cas3'' [Enterococcus thailandicus]
MTIAYYARSPNAAGDYETVCHHLTLTSALCAEFLSPVGAQDAGAALGTLHDLGKYSDLFAAVLRHQREHVNHAAPGAAVALARYGDRDVGRLLAVVIAAHHSQLSNAILQELRRLSEGSGDPWDENRNEFSIFGPNALSTAFTLLRGEVQLSQARPTLPPWQGGQDVDLSYMLCARFLFSALVDADYSASASHFEPDYINVHTGPPLDPADALKRLLALREEKRRTSRAATPLNALRDQLFEDCLCAADLPPGLFTLTAPTGLGKTLSLFAFAAKHAQHFHKRRIILILPFLALAEQNTWDYRQAVPELLESHSAAVLNEQARLLAERWSAPCIVTTTVG